ncbi:VOC family protein [Sphingomonas sp. GB1N7]|uniref:VOC family protein n=1 Tax=Parasphingomonas caseinilytica TaxID=3096158 RepID=UPI002FC76246
MELQALGYIGVRSGQLDEWSAYAVGLLGMQKVDAASGMRAFRMDDRKQRLVVSAEDGDTIGFIGWEVADAAALDRLATRLEANGVAVRRGNRALADERRVADLIVFHDPIGNRLEAFYGAEIACDRFVPGRPISGFKTGPLGLGHVVLNVPDVDALLPFYRDLLGFRVTDYGLTPYKLYFFHINARHHSFAMVGTGKSSFHHFMVELFSLDDIGQGYDLAQLQDGRIAYTLGRHTNDHMTSFYSNSPSGFFVEYGWGAREIDPATWQPYETFDGPSFWGHERLYMPEEQRTRLREMRLDTAARGVRAPVVIDCPWLDAIVSQE